MDDKETARQHGQPMVVFTQPDVCKSPVAPVPYPIVAPLTPSVDIASTVRATSVPTFTLKSRVPLVIGDEAGVGLGVKSGTFSGTGMTWPTGSSSTVRAEKFLLVRNGDPFMMNGGNTTGKLVYQPGGAPRAGIDAAGRPTRNTNPRVQPTQKEQGWFDWMGEKAGNAWEGTKGVASDAWQGTKGLASDAWDGTKQLAGDAYDYGKYINNEYKVVPRALGGLQAVGGVAEMGAGAVGLAAPTGITQVAGGVAVVHGADNTSTGLRQLWTGNYENTLTHQAAAGTARLLGASEGTAEAVGNITDLGAGVVAPAAALKGAAQQELRTLAQQEAKQLAQQEVKQLAQQEGKQLAQQEGKQLAQQEGKQAAQQEGKQAAQQEARAAAEEGADGVRVLKKPARPDTSKVKYPDDVEQFKGPDGKWKYPENDGFAGKPIDDTLKKGQVVDRFGGDGGSYLSPPGTPYDARALPPSSLNSPYRAFEVMKDLPVQSGGIAPAFGMPGGGTQFFLGERTIGDLVRDGFLREIH